MANRVGVIARGELILVEDKTTLMTKLGKRQLKLTLKRPLDEVPPELAADGVSLCRGGAALVYTFDSTDERQGIPAILQKLAASGIEFTDLETSQSSLEDIFIRLVRADH
jgi:ABC-2 type transport system ATP-binding protein